MRRLRRTGIGAEGNALPDEAKSPPDGGTSPADPASVEPGAAQAAAPGGLAARRRRRLRRLVIASPFLVVLVWAVVSYTAWMLRADEHAVE